MRGWAFALSVVIAGCGFDSSGAGSGPDPDPDPPLPGEARLEIVFDNSARGDIFDVPIAVALTPAHFDYDLASVDGSDLAFFDSDGVTRLPHEIEHWEADGTSLVWVLVPSIDAGSVTDHVLLDYGATAAAQNPDALWAGFHAVYHFAQDPDVARAARDSSANGFDAALQGTAARSTGVAASALALDGNGYLELEPKDAFAMELDETQTIEACVRAPRNAGDRTVITNESSCSGFQVSIVDEGYALGRFVGGNDCATSDSVHLADWNGDQQDDVWYYIAFVIDRASNVTELYINGVRVDARAANNTLPATGYTTRIGADFSTGDRFIGQIDEVRVSAAARSADWIDAQAAAILGTLVTYRPL